MIMPYCCKVSPDIDTLFKPCQIVLSCVFYLERESCSIVWYLRNVVENPLTLSVDENWLWKVVSVLPMLVVSWSSHDALNDIAVSHSSMTCLSWISHRETVINPSNIRRKRLNKRSIFNGTSWIFSISPVRTLKNLIYKERYFWIG